MDESTSPPDAEVARFDAILGGLKSRLDSSKIPYVREELDGFEGTTPILRMKFPCGRETRNVSILDSDSLQSLSEMKFEHYSFLGELSAICSYADRTIESGLRFMGPWSNRILSRKLFGVDNPGSEWDEASKLTLVSEEHGIQVEISPSSPEYRLLCRSVRMRALTFKIVGASIERHDLALELLRRLANSVAFQLEISSGISFRLQADRRRLVGRSRFWPSSTPGDLQFPKHEYDDAPISLYWYGRHADGFPLLEFLAYYQCIEYYFPTYSRAEATRRLRSILKSPAFRTDRDSDIAKLLGAFPGGGAGDERSQLLSTITECISAEDLRRFITEDEERARFLSAKADGLTEHRIPLGNIGADLRVDVASRIYDIRCRIVHSKSGLRDADKMLLPFSEQADHLLHDIELLRFIARSVLIAASTPLRL